MKRAKTSERNIFFCKRHRSFILLAIVVVTSVLSFCSLWVCVLWAGQCMFNNTLPPSLRPRQTKLVTIWPAWPSLLQAASASSLLLDIVYIEIFASIFQKFSIVVTAQQTARICETIFNKVWAASSFCILNLNHLQTGLYLHLYFFFTNLCLQAIFHILTFAAPSCCLAAGCPNICSKLGIRKQFGVFSEAGVECGEKLGIWAEYVERVSLTLVWPDKI